MSLVLMLGIMLASWLVGARFKSRFKLYAATPLSSGLTGEEVALRMLAEHNIKDVQVISTGGQLTDHYDPTKRTVNLSQEVYYGRSVAAAAVAAHEVGHAVQHATAYSWLQFARRWYLRSVLPAGSCHGFSWPGC